MPQFRRVTRRLGLFAAVLVTAGLGVLAAVALADVGATSVCATTPAQTLAVNGNPVSTVPAETACASVPTVTQTVTIGGASTTPTTTSPITTATSSNPTFASETAYTANRPAFTASRIIAVSNASALKTAIANLRPGDYVKASAPFTVSGSATEPLIISNRLLSPAVIDLTGVKIAYTGTGNTASVYLADPSNIRIYGGDITTGQGGTCILAHGSQHILWWGFNVHDCGASGLLITPVGAPVDHDDFQGTVMRAAMSTTYDPCLEKGACFHGVNLWDSGSAYAFTNNRFAFDISDIPHGSCVEDGNSVVAPAAGNVLYERCVNETFVATVQTGGSGLQLHGSTGLGLDVRYLEVSNAEGRAVDTNGQHVTAGVTVDYGRANETNLNAALNEPNPSLPWDPREGVIYRDVQPFG